MIYCIVLTANSRGDGMAGGALYEINSSSENLTGTSPKKAKRVACTCPNCKAVDGSVLLYKNHLFYKNMSGLDLYI